MNQLYHPAVIHLDIRLTFPRLLIEPKWVNRRQEGIVHCDGTKEQQPERLRFLPWGGASKESLDFDLKDCLWASLFMLSSALPLFKLFFSIYCLDSNIILPYSPVPTPTVYYTEGKEIQVSGRCQLVTATVQSSYKCWQRCDLPCNKNLSLVKQTVIYKLYI